MIRREIMDAVEFGRQFAAWRKRSGIKFDNLSSFFESTKNRSYWVKLMAGTAGCTPELLEDIYTKTDIPRQYSPRIATPRRQFSDLSGDSYENLSEFCKIFKKWRTDNSLKFTDLPDIFGDTWCGTMWSSMERDAQGINRLLLDKIYETIPALAGLLPKKGIIKERLEIGDEPESVIAKGDRLFLESRRKKRSARRARLKRNAIQNKQRFESHAKTFAGGLYD